MSSALLSTVKEIIQEVGDPLTKYFGNIEVTNNKSGRAVDVVTRLDRETENLLAEKLNKYDPTIGFCGEEFGQRQKSEKFWLVDPIDGTAHFVRGIPFCTSMIALVDRGEVVLSVIYNFVTKELFEAEKGMGTKLNGESIHVSDRPLKDSYIAVEVDLNIDENVEKFRQLRNKCIVLTTINCGYEYGLVASGKIEGRICIDPFGKDWDYAPGSLLISEAGGIIVNTGKSTYDYRNHNFLAVNKEVYEELTEGPDALF
jgi:myo-inositol-1(or 4)-monophosphatase